MFWALRQAVYTITAIRQTGDSAKILSKMPAEKYFLGLFNCEHRHTYAPITYQRISSLKCRIFFHFHRELYINKLIWYGVQFLNLFSFLITLKFIQAFFLVRCAGYLFAYRRDCEIMLLRIILASFVICEWGLKDAKSSQTW